MLKGILNKDHQLQLDSIPGSDVLAKLLISVLWKNGDLHKLQHIVDGITGKNTSTSKQNIVFGQFGKSLTRTGEPIIDQHVLRAFACYRYPEKKDHFLKKKIYKNSDVNVVKDYVLWFKTQINRFSAAEQSASGQLLDRILFITGKKIK